jgi:hypothetical protein
VSNHVVLDYPRWLARVRELENAQKSLRAQLRGTVTGRRRCPTCNHSHPVRSSGRNITSFEGKDDYHRRRELRVLYYLRSIERWGAREIDSDLWGDRNLVHRLFAAYTEYMIEPPREADESTMMVVDDHS